MTWFPRLIVSRRVVNNKFDSSSSQWSGYLNQMKKTVTENTSNIVRQMEVLSSESVRTNRDQNHELKSTLNQMNHRFDKLLNMR